MKSLLKALNIVKNNKKCTSKKDITSHDVEHLNAGNSTSTWGIVFYR